MIVRKGHLADFPGFVFLCHVYGAGGSGMNSGTFMAFMALRLGTTVAILAKEASIMTSNKFLPFVPDGTTFYQWGSREMLSNKERPILN